MKTYFFAGCFIALTISSFAQVNKERVDQKFVKEINKLTRDKRILAAFSEIDNLNPTTIKELILLTEIPSPPFKEGERARRFEQLLKEAGGVKVWIDSIGNVLALRKGIKSERTVALDGHLDTVFPEGTDVTVKRRGDTLYAPGIGDNTRGLMVILTVLRAMEKANIQTNDDILFVGTVGEEGMGDLRGVKFLFGKSSIKIASWISIDHDGMGAIANRGTGALRYRVRVSGPGGHSWADFGLPNPHHALAKMIDHFADNASQFTSVAKARTSFNVGIIGGGTSVNAIPFESWMDVDLRSEDDRSLGAIDSIFRSSLHRGLEEYNSNHKMGPALTMTIERVGSRPSGTVEEHVPLIQRSMAAVQYFGLTPTLKTMSGNANLPISKGIPAVTLGWGGRSDHAHALNEWWLDDKGTDAIKLALLTLVAESGVGKGK